MNTQSGAESPHICTALEHCHQLNERLADLEGWVRLVDGATQRAHGDIGDLRELTNRMQGAAAVSEQAFIAAGVQDAKRHREMDEELKQHVTVHFELRDQIEALRRDMNTWHNALAEESRKHAAALATHRDAIDALERALQLPLSGPKPHCRTCFCDLKASR